MQSPLLSRPKAIASRVVQSIDGVTRSVGALGPGAFGWPAAIGIGLGVGIFALHEPRYLHGVLKPRATTEFTRPALGAIAISTIATLVGVLAVALVRRRRGRGLSFGEEYTGTLRRAAFLAALPLVVALEEPLELRRDWLVLGFVATVALLVTYSSYFWLEEPRAWRGARPLTRFLPWIAIGVAMVAYTVLMLRLSLTNHLSFNTGRTDLGYYVSRLRESSEGRLLQCSLCNSAKRPFFHFEPILLLLAPLYRLYPFAETLLVSQTLWLASGAGAVFLLAERLAHSRSIAVSLAVAYLAYPAVHGENLSGFHSITLAVPLFLWLLYFLEREAMRPYLIVLAILLLVREDVALALGAVGLVAIFSGSTERARMGFLTVAAACLWAIAVRALGGPTPFASFAALSSRVGETPLRAHGGLLQSGALADGPVAAISRAFATDKMDYVAKLLVPLLGIPLLARGRILLAYGAALTLFATVPEVTSLHFEHSSLLVPFLFALAAAGLARLAATQRPIAFVSGPKLARALGVGIALGTVLSSWKLGALVENGSFRAGAQPLARSVTPDQFRLDTWLKKLSRSFPKGVKVAATSHLIPHLGSASHLYSLEDRSRADYVVANMKERGIAKVLAAEEARGYLVRTDSSAEVRLYRTRYRGFVPTPSKRLDDE
jgi:uncharacterized membrane protein